MACASSDAINSVLQGPGPFQAALQGTMAPRQDWTQLALLIHATDAEATPGAAVVTEGQLTLLLV